MGEIMLDLRYISNNYPAAFRSIAEHVKSNKPTSKLVGDAARISCMFELCDDDCCLYDDVMDIILNAVNWEGRTPKLGVLSATP